MQECDFIAMNCEVEYKTSCCSNGSDCSHRRRHTDHLIYRFRRVAQMCAHYLIHGCLDPHNSASKTDRFSRFAELTSVRSIQTRRQHRPRNVRHV